jgi:hypothetical protein
VHPLPGGCEPSRRAVRGASLASIVMSFCTVCSVRLTDGDDSKAADRPLSNDGCPATPVVAQL